MQRRGSDTVRRALVESYLAQLIGTFGVEPEVERTTLRGAFNRQDYAGMIRHIQGQLRIGLAITFGRVNAGGPDDAPAWIRLPEPMPPFGTPEYQRLKPILFIRRGFLETASFEQLVVAIAHEMCHVLLDATGHALRREEEAVDLAAMIKGYGSLYADVGRNGERTGAQLGYLKPQEIEYALRAIGGPPSARPRHRRQPHLTYGWRWAVALVAIAASGVGGFFVGHQLVPPSSRPLDLSAFGSPVDPNAQADPAAPSAPSPSAHRQKVRTQKL